MGGRAARFAVPLVRRWAEHDVVLADEAPCRLLDAPEARVPDEPPVGYGEPDLGAIDVRDVVLHVADGNVCRPQDAGLRAAKPRTAAGSIRILESRSMSLTLKMVEPSRMNR